MTQHRRVFLAHAREDKERVRALYEQLQQRGLRPWLDEKDLIPGQVWQNEIRKVIREAGAFIACLSQISVHKEGYVQTEFRLALTAYGERPPGTIYFIPVKLDDCEIPDLQMPHLGLSIRDFHWLNLWQEGGFEELILALEKSQDSKDGISQYAPAGSRAKGDATDGVTRPATSPAEVQEIPDTEIAEGHNHLARAGWFLLILGLLCSFPISLAYMLGYTSDSNWVIISFRFTLIISVAAIILFYMHGATQPLKRPFLFLFLTPASVFVFHLLGVLFLSAIIWTVGGAFSGLWSYYFNVFKNVFKYAAMDDYPHFWVWLILIGLATVTGKIVWSLLRRDEDDL